MMINMDNSMLSKAMLITWAGLGIEIDRLDDSPDGIICYISVPRSTTHLNAYSEQMAGQHLAKRFKQALTEMGIKFSVCKFKVREEDWDDNKKYIAEEAVKKQLS